MLWLIHTDQLSREEIREYNGFFPGFSQLKMAGPSLPDDFVALLKGQGVECYSCPDQSQRTGIDGCGLFFFLS